MSQVSPISLTVHLKILQKQKIIKNIEIMKFLKYESLRFIVDAKYLST